MPADSLPRMLEPLFSAPVTAESAGSGAGWRCSGLDGDALKVYPPPLSPFFRILGLTAEESVLADVVKSTMTACGWDMGVVKS
ncbi:MAG: hypothetical protein WCD00_07325 [Desulfuromonadaceae bacterium]